MPTVEILTFAGCPHREAARALVERVLRETGTPASVAVTDVETPDHAVALRFLGSPTIRVDGRDVEPGAEPRESFALACRVYATAAGPAGLPEERWLVEALAA